MTEERLATSRRGFIRAAAGGGTIASAAGTAAGQEGNESGGGNKSGGNESGGGGGGGGGGKTVSKTVTVGPGGEPVFEPKSVQVTPGSTVTWKWDSQNHNVVPSSQPDKANWKGTEGAPSKTYNAGHTYEHTFETLGAYEYFCEPHKSLGMTGTVEVVESIATPEQTGPVIPDSAKTLGIATSVAMLSTLGLAYTFLKYGGPGPD